MAEEDDPGEMICHLCGSDEIPQIVCPLCHQWACQDHTRTVRPFYDTCTDHEERGFERGQR